MQLEAPRLELSATKIWKLVCLEWPVPEPLPGEDGLAGHHLQGGLPPALLHLLRLLHFRLSPLPVGNGETKFLALLNKSNPSHFS